MTILCGTDFSAGAVVAGRTAAAMARGLGTSLELVHALAGECDDEGAPPSGAEEPACRARLDAEAERLRADFAVVVEPRLVSGGAAAALLEAAARDDAEFLVLGSLGAGADPTRLLGTVAERVAQTSTRPVLVVRAGARLERWAAGEGTLRVVVGVDRSETSRAALAWARGLRAVGAVELSAAELVWPAEEHQRAGVAAPIPLDSLRPEVAAAALDALRRWAGDDPEPGGTSLVVEPAWGRVDSALLRLASEARADLLVVGTHQRATLARLWHGSVSRGALREAAMSVACVPLDRAAEE